MEEVEIKFEREGLHGIVAVGSYLIDAMKRFGLRPESPCDRANGEHFCLVEIRSGKELLSPRTEAEISFLAEKPGTGDKRLACQAKFDRAGEVVVMTEEKKGEDKADVKPPMTDEEYLKAFSELPLEKKMASLVKLEAVALSDTLAYMANAPYTVASKLMDIMADLGFRRHAEEKAAARPPEHVTADPETVNGSAEPTNGSGGEEKSER